MDDWSSYRGKVTVVTGCSSGVGKAVASQLHFLGAEVHGIARSRPVDIEMASFCATDLRNPASIDAAVANLGDRKVQALFNCAGLPTASEAMDICKVNYIGHRYLADRLLPRIPEGGAIASVASTAGNGWGGNVEALSALMALSDYQEMTAWFEKRVAEGENGYGISKQAQIFWTLYMSTAAIEKGVRVNCTVPGPITTPFLDRELELYPEALIAVNTKPIGRRSTPNEQAAPLLFLNSEAAGIVNGAALPTDGGFSGAVSSGRFDLGKLYQDAMQA